MTLFDSGIRPAIDAYLLGLSKQRRDYGDYWSASSAGYCMRKNIFERLKVPHVETESDARKQRVFTAGHIFHEWMQDLTTQAGLSVAQELELLDDTLMVKGHFDDLVVIDGHLILYDYKTVNSRSFMWARKEKKANDGIQPMSHFHRMQLGTYLYMFRNPKVVLADELKPFKKELTEGRICKVEKDTLMMDEQQLIWNPKLAKDVAQYWRTLNGYWNAKKLPKCTCADFEGGFMAKEQYNPYFYKGEPCSLAWYLEWKEKYDDNSKSE